MSVHLNPEWIGAITAVAALAATFAAWVVRGVWRIFGRTSRFLDDYFGEPARPGVLARPGVMARLTAVEDMTRTIRAETQPNGGSSMRDAIHGIAGDVADVKDEQVRLRTQIELRNPPAEGI